MVQGFNLGRSLPKLILYCIWQRWIASGSMGAGWQRGGWSHDFSRQFNDRELNEADIFLQKLQTLSIKREVEDKLR